MPPDPFRHLTISLSIAQELVHPDANVRFAAKNVLRKAVDELVTKRKGYISTKNEIALVLRNENFSEEIVLELTPKLAKALCGFSPA
jgi:ribosomal protein L17